MVSLTLVVVFVLVARSTSSLGFSRTHAARNATLFQLVDASHLGLWINWWAVALATDAVPAHWRLHLTCIGNRELDAVVRSIHAPGCSQIISSNQHLNRIYYAKALAFTTALRLGHDLLILDVDAVLLRNPTLWLLTPNRSHFDVISSRDNGPSKLPNSRDWGPHRFCTGLIFLRYSPHVLDFVEYVLRKVERLGHDQIQFNSAISSSGLVWESGRRAMENELLPDIDVAGFFAWPWGAGQTLGFDATDARWQEPEPEKKKVAVDESLVKMPMGKSVAGLDMPRRKLHVQLLASSSVLRYCHQPSPTTNKVKSRFIENAMPLSNASLRTAALHCFWDEGHRGEQGLLKRELKTMIALGLHYWVLRDAYTVATASLGVVNSSTSSSASLLFGRSHPANRLFLRRFVDRRRMHDFQQVWIVRNATHPITNPVRAMIKRGFFISKLGSMPPIESASTSSNPRDAAYNRTRPRRGRPRLESA